jgi:hypothetical protein
MVTIHSPGALPRASSAMRSWMSLIERTRPSEGNTSRNASRSIWAWPSIKPGVTLRPCRSMTRDVGAVCAAIAASDPTATILSPAIATACATLERASMVMTLPFLRMRSAGGVAGAAGCAPADEARAAAAAAIATAAPVTKLRRGSFLSAMPPSRRSQSRRGPEA